MRCLLATLVRDGHKRVFKHSCRRFAIDLELDSGSEGELPELVVVKSLLLSSGFEAGFVLGQSAAEGAGLLHSQVLGGVLALSGFGAGGGDSLLAEHGHHSGDGLSHLLRKSVRVVHHVHLHRSWKAWQCAGKKPWSL